MMLGRAELGVLLIAGSLAGCDGCSCTNAITDKIGGEIKKEMERPPVEIIHPKVTALLLAAKEIASDMCGIPTSGLTVVKITEDELPVKIPGGGYVRVEGTPVDGPKVTAAGAPLLCIAVISYSFRATRNADGSVKEWNATRVGLSSVSTPGVSWKPPPGEGGDWD